MSKLAGIRQTLKRGTSKLERQHKFSQKKCQLKILLPLAANAYYKYHCCDCMQFLVDHSSSMRSSPPDASMTPSGEISMQLTAEAWPSPHSKRTHLAEATSHTLMDASSEPDASRDGFGWKAQQRTSARWPHNRRMGCTESTRHTRSERSCPHVAKYGPTGAKATDQTGEVCAR